MTIYFIQRDSDGAIKIGHAKDLEMRVQQHRSEIGAIRVLGYMSGGHDGERALHLRFAAHCISGVYSTGKTKGEWFRPALEILEYIEASAKPYRDLKEVQVRFSIPLEMYNKFRLFLDGSGKSIHDVAREVFTTHAEVIDYDAPPTSTLHTAQTPSATASRGRANEAEAVA